MWLVILRRFCLVACCYCCVTSEELWSDCDDMSNCNLDVDGEPNNQEPWGQSGVEWREPINCLRTGIGSQELGLEIENLKWDIEELIIKIWLWRTGKRCVKFRTKKQSLEPKSRTRDLESKTQDLEPKSTRPRAKKQTRSRTRTENRERRVEV